MIIAFMGLAGSGKSTAANYVKEKYGYERINFKDGLVAEMKDRLAGVLEALVKVYYNAVNLVTVDDLFKVKPPAMRALMQNYGTEVRRRDDENYWVRFWKSSVTGKENVAVDDCRFINEAEAVKEMGGFVIRINRTDIQSAGGHQSETELNQITPDAEWTLEPGDHDGLYRKIDLFIDLRKNEAGQ